MEHSLRDYLDLLGQDLMDLRYYLGPALANPSPKAQAWAKECQALLIAAGHTLISVANSPNDPERLARGKKVHEAISALKAHYMLGWDPKLVADLDRITGKPFEHEEGE